MRQVRRSALVATTPERMFALINDIARYPEFVPGCADATVLEQSADQIVARLAIQRGLLRTGFTTRNRLSPPHSVKMELVSGPFRSLDGLWTLVPVLSADQQHAVGCRVTLDLSFEMDGVMANLTMGPLMEQMAGSLVDAFAARGRDQGLGSTLSK